MTTTSLVLDGIVLPGPTMAPPYAFEGKCVAWAAGHTGEVLAASSGALQFLFRADDGREFRVDPAGCVAEFPIRLQFAFERSAVARIEDGLVNSRWHKVDKRVRVNETHVVAWLEIGARITVEGNLALESALFRGPQMLRATALRIVGGPTLTANPLEPADPDNELPIALPPE